MLNVFVSSTVFDLADYRKVVSEVVLDCQMHPVDMEHGRAVSATPVAYSLDFVEQADVYIGLFAHRYGDCPEGSEISITEMEYRRAVARAIPRLIFLIKDDHPVVPRNIDDDAGKVQRLKRLKAELRAEQTVDFFDTPVDLRYKVLKALAGLREDLASGATRWRAPWLTDTDLDPSGDRNQQLEVIEEQLAVLGLGYEEIRTLYRRSLPSDLAMRDVWDLPRGISPKATLHRALVRLADAPTSAGTVAPVLEFAERATVDFPDACQAVRESVDAAARAWSEALEPLRALRLELDRNRSHRERLHLERPSTSSVYLQICMDPAGGDPSAFFAQAWLVHDESKQECLYASDIRHTFESLPSLLKRLLNMLGRNPAIDAAAGARLTIEFFLPCVYFTRDVDATVIDDVAVGIEYRVVIRSLERIRNASWHHRWKTKWNSVCGQRLSDDTNHVRWMHKFEKLDLQAVFADLVDDQVLCLGFTSVPPRSTARCENGNMMHLALRAGVPIMLWPRRLPRNGAFAHKAETDLKDLLGRNRLSDLPDHLLRARREAAKAKHAGTYHVGQWLSLLWDDPNRVPTDAEETAMLEEPAIRR